jgi:hypothetical protein
MRDPRERQVGAMRRLLSEARADNSRMVAAAIGGHLSRITRDGSVPELEGPTETVRDASLDLLKAINRSDGVARARKAALRSVDTLAAALPAAAPDGPPSPPVRINPLRRLAMRTLPALRAVQGS